jgi:hypothetical protein
LLPFIKAALLITVFFDTYEKKAKKKGREKGWQEIEMNRSVNYRIIIQ